MSMVSSFTGRSRGAMPLSLIWDRWATIPSWNWNLSICLRSGRRGRPVCPKMVGLCSSWNSGDLRKPWRREQSGSRTEKILSTWKVSTLWARAPKSQRLTTISSKYSKYCRPGVMDSTRVSKTLKSVTFAQQQIYWNSEFQRKSSGKSLSVGNGWPWV